MNDVERTYKVELKYVFVSQVEGDFERMIELRHPDAEIDVLEEALTRLASRIGAD